MDHKHWRVEHLFMLVPAQAYVAKFLETLQQFPPRQRPAGFFIDQVIGNMKQGARGR